MRRPGSAAVEQRPLIPFRLLQLASLLKACVIPMPVASKAVQNVRVHAEAGLRFGTRGKILEDATDQARKGRKRGSRSQRHSVRCTQGQGNAVQQCRLSDKSRLWNSTGREGRETRCVWLQCVDEGRPCQAALKAGQPWPPSLEELIVRAGELLHLPDAGVGQAAHLRATGRQGGRDKGVGRASCWRHRIPPSAQAWRPAWRRWTGEALVCLLPWQARPGGLAVQSLPTEHCCALKQPPAACARPPGWLRRPGRWPPAPRPVPGWSAAAPQSWRRRPWPGGRPPAAHREK